MSGPFKQVYVEIISPFRSLNSTKENAQLDRPTTSATLKRKRSLIGTPLGPENGTDPNSNVSSSKKTEKSITARQSTRSGMSPQPNANEEFPLGFFYCHQCARKYPPHSEHKYCVADSKLTTGRWIALHFYGQEQSEMRLEVLCRLS
jgi:hypothetical protein